jgi:hypothetical protein
MTPTMMNDSATEEFQWTDWVWAVVTCVLLLLPGLTYGETTRVPYPIQMITATRQPYLSTLQIQARTLFPNACFKAETNGGRLRDPQTIELVNYALVSDGHCTQRIESAGLVVNMERPMDGIYHVLDATDQRFLGYLEMRDGIARIFPQEEL